MTSFWSSVREQAVESGARTDALGERRLVGAVDAYLGRVDGGAPSPAFRPATSSAFSTQLAAGKTRETSPPERSLGASIILPGEHHVHRPSTCRRSG